MCEIWGSQRSQLRPTVKDMRDWVVKAFVWNIWLVMNDLIFNANVLPAFAIILKSNRMILSWFSAVTEGSREKFDDSITTIRHSLEFLSQSSGVVSGDLIAEEAFHQILG